MIAQVLDRHIEITSGVERPAWPVASRASHHRAEYRRLARAHGQNGR